MRKSAMLLSLAAVAGLSAGVAQAAPIFTDVGSGGWRTNYAGQIHSSFIPAADMTIGSIGYWDNGGDGLVDAHFVQLYTFPGWATVINTTVPAGSSTTLIGGYRYVDLDTPVNLTAGTTYLLTAFTTTGDGFRDTPGTPTITSTLVTIGEDYWGWTFDNQSSGEWTAANLSTTTVPEPATLGLVGLGLMGVLIRRRKASV